MSEPIPERADIRQLRTQAKELLRSLQSGETVVPGITPTKAKLSDAQLLIARKYGFDSWPKLVDKVETPILIEKLKHAVDFGDDVALEKLLRTHASLRRHINDPIFPYDSHPIQHAAASPRSEFLVPILVRFGADPNLRSAWWAGGFSALDRAHGKTVDVLLSAGAKFDVWSAASKGRIDVLQDLLDERPEMVNAPGGDGQRPLHFAANAEVAEFLIQRGADLEVRDVDHEGTPIQYHVNHPEILRVLLSHGAEPDIFTAAVLNDVELARKIITNDPDALDARVGSAPFSTVHSHGGHIYCYTLGSEKSVLQVAAERKSQEVLDELLKHVSPARRLIVAAWQANETAVHEIVRKHPNIGKEMGRDARSITDAAQAGKVDAVRLLLFAGLDPMTPGLDMGSALHTACWFGYVDVVKLLIPYVPIDLLDEVHQSPPLGWAAHGSHWCRNEAGDYVAVVEALIQAGADPNAPANHHGVSMLTQAGNREDVKDVLRHYGAK